jgi:hypothetical protein
MHLLYINVEIYILSTTPVFYFVLPPSVSQILIVMSAQIIFVLVECEGLGWRANDNPFDAPKLKR